MQEVMIAIDGNPHDIIPHIKCEGGLLRSPSVILRESGGSRACFACLRIFDALDSRFHGACPTLGK